ncbi:protoporphyrinogen oxidase [Rossellomorea aquimaris]|uniref:protoporphyrinogen oxidase n=1 Tax=Rossellomorea aquimaris TaxID=189382 RepID=UPI001CD4D17A|nr:protoporphyrinogen oxidase [Rossellomorea aquimaris]MCA1056457.1 protoporphyrinogen oxidase [Rossellomorea aquimaris]
MRGQQVKTVVVIGGGITGLTAAYYLQKKIKEMNLPIHLKLVEATHRLGGKIQTLKQDGYIIERGPDSFVPRNQSPITLAKEIGLDDTLVASTWGKSYVIAGGELYPMPGGSIIGIPTQIAPFITTNLFSLTGKMRAAADFILPRSTSSEDQSLGRFFRRRMGDEVVDNLIEPLLTGIYAGDIDQLSLMSTFPELHEIEQKHRSLIAGIKKAASRYENEEKNGRFLTFSNGLQSLVEGLENALDPGVVNKGMKVSGIDGEAEHGYTIRFTNGQVLDADGVVITTPHHSMQSMFPNLSFMDYLKDMPATSVATVAMGFDSGAIKKNVEGNEFIVSRNSDYSITACTWTHKKWPHTVPDGKVLIRCYLGKSGDETIVDLSDDQIQQIVLEDLEKIVHLDGEPEFTLVTRYKDSMPQYTVGHRERTKDLYQKLEDRLPGIFIAGSSYDGLGIPECIEQGEKVVEKIIQYMKR